MTYDAKYIYIDITQGTVGDWQSPAMAALWKAIDPIAPGPASMLLLVAACSMPTQLGSFFSHDDKIVCHLTAGVALDAVFERRLKIEFDLQRFHFSSLHVICRGMPPRLGSIKQRATRRRAARAGRESVRRTFLKAAKRP